MWIILKIHKSVLDNKKMLLKSRSWCGVKVKLIVSNIYLCTKSLNYKFITQIKFILHEVIFRSINSLSSSHLIYAIGETSLAWKQKETKTRVSLSKGKEENIKIPTIQNIISTYRGVFSNNINFWCLKKNDDKIV